MTKSQCPRALRFERLENRLTLDGNVTAYVSGPNLVLIGDDLPNEVSMFRLQTAVGDIPAGAYILMGGTGGGDSAASAPTTINGQPYVVIRAQPTRSSSLYVDLRGGDDVLMLGNSQNFNTDTGQAFDGVTSLLNENYQALIDAQASQLEIRNSVYLRLGQGDDVLGLDGLVVNRDLYVDTGSTESTGVGANYGYNDFVMGLNSWVGRNAGIRTSQGNDAVLLGSTPNTEENQPGLTSNPFEQDRSIPGMAVGKSLITCTGAGDDDVSLNNTSAPRVGAFLGTGNDNLSFSYVWIWWLRADGDSDNDTISARPTNGVNVLKREIWNFETQLV
jgi:hypothetical protein